MRTAGTTRFDNPLTPQQEARFWAKVDRREPSQCWRWVGARNAKGYGQFGVRVEGQGIRGYRAHRLAYELRVGPIPPTKVLDHTCHVPGECAPPCAHRQCVNPEHLRVTTDAGNAHSSRRATTRRHSA